MAAEGWIKVDRKIVEWEWYKDVAVKTLFIHMILSANHKEQRWRGIQVKRGQMITGRHSLADDTGLTEQQIRTALKKLTLTNEIVVKPTSHFSIITICKYDDYQLKENGSNQPSTSHQPTANQPLTTNKNDNNDKNEKKLVARSTPPKSLDERLRDFKLSLIPYMENYGQPMLKDFCEYWTEKNQNGKKMRFEMERTFEVTRRLAKWKRKADEFKIARNKVSVNPGKVQ